MAISRRQFLKRSSLVAAGSVLGPGVWGNPFVQRALANTIGNKYLLVFFLDGGNDGLNTVTPAGTTVAGNLRHSYEAARRPLGGGGIRLTQAELASTLVGTDPNTGHQLALHPGFATGFKPLYDAGKLALIQGCGYPDYSLSHEVSRHIWEAANPTNTALQYGWLGRFLATCYTGNDVPAVNILSYISGEFQQSTTSVLTIENLQRFGFPYDGAYEYEFSPGRAAHRAAFDALYQAAKLSPQASAEYLGDGGLATLLSSESYPALHDAYVSARPDFNEQYGGNGLDTSTARNLREVAKIIFGVEQGASNVNARFFEVHNGGYDTHSNQGGAAANGNHYGLHQEVSEAIKLFYDDLGDMASDLGGASSDLQDRVLILVWSEFSRRIKQNDNGTDHGSQGPMFVIGGGVTGGVYGNHPNITPAALDDDGNTVYSQNPGNTGYSSTDFRDVYGTILKNWLGMPDNNTIKSQILPLDLGDPNLYWTTENFDLGFI